MAVPPTRTREHGHHREQGQQSHRRRQRYERRLRRSLPDGKDAVYLMIAGVSLGLAFILLLGIPYALRQFIVTKPISPTHAYHYNSSKNKTRQYFGHTIISVLQTDIAKSGCLKGLESIIYAQKSCILQKTSGTCEELTIEQREFITRQMGSTQCLKFVPLLRNILMSKCRQCFGSRGGWSTSCVEKCVHYNLSKRYVC